MTKQSSQIISTKVGLFVVIGIAILAASILTLGTMRKSFITRIDANATFVNVNGLTKGNYVWFSGLKVGTVREITFTPYSQVRVVFSIEEESQKFIKKDALVRVSSDGLIGNPIFLISGGSPSVPMIENGHEFRIEKEESTQEMMKTLQENNKNILSFTEDLKSLVAHIRAGQGSIGKLITDDAMYENLRKSLTTAETATKDLKQGASGLAALANKLNAEGFFFNSLDTNKEFYSAIKNKISTL
jgi:phospholipid/cholesterol/gamma-HCH transport system substrate-binding protein